ncbi:hypothetical protein SERLADRAFT_472187, partial [Serpula lacrymans var. lacrymans S7.9]
MIMASNISLRMLTPRWAYLLPIERLRRVEAGFTNIFAFMKSQVAYRLDSIRKNEMVEDDDLGTNTVFNNIVKASVDGGKFTLNEGEVIGNTFVMLFAGHETSSRTLTAALALLGLYQDKQEQALFEIERVLPGRREPIIQDFESFKYILNIIQETMRLYPPIPLVVREAIQDTLLTITDPTTGQKVRDVV